MGLTKREAGALLAFLAGLTLIGFATWPFPSAQVLRWGDFGAVWLVGAMALGALFLIAPFFVDDRPVLVRAVLIVGALALIGSALLFGGPLQGGPRSALMDVIPAVFAFLAGWLLRPASRADQPARPAGARPSADA
ncbi:MAG TPA: hypothetical protein VHL09_16195 [Dehalococcoidia bacterium]|nr:hypothetical protein [Dehalococcoidia bacterium]